METITKTKEDQAYLFTLKTLFAKNKGIPVSIEARILKETQYAVYLYGHGTVHPNGKCCRCGRTLTHPGSILLGIGPECLNDWSARDIKMDNMTDADKEYISGLITSQKVDTWLPKRVIKSATEIDKIIEVENHVMMAPKRNNRSRDAKPARRVEIVKNRFIVRFPYDPTDVQVARSLEGRKYDPDTKSWNAPLSITNYKILRTNKFPIIGVSKDQLALLFDETPAAELKPLKIPGLRKKLYPFQEQGVAFLEKNGGRALIGDEMGLGKTVQALGYIQLHRKEIPAIIVCPASLKLNWKYECRRWLSKPVNVEVLSGKNPYQTSGDVLIINYDILKEWADYLIGLNPKIVVTDECHYYKNRKANRTRAVQKVAKHVEKFIAVSGTPIENRPMEIFTAVDIIRPGSLGNFWNFAKRYCGATHNGYGWDFSGATNVQELHEKLIKNVMIRRKKKDVLKDLPLKSRSFVPMESTNQKEYQAARNNFINYLKEKKGEEAASKAAGAETLVRINELLQLAVEGKMKAAIEWIEDFLESGQKLVVFATHTKTLDILEEKFKDIVVRIDGSTSAVKRDAAVRAFQNDVNARLFIGNIKAAGVGITLTAASNVAILELPWTPGALEQAIDRCHRIGQKDNVMAWLLLSIGTIEEDMARLLDAKLKVLDQVLDGKITDDSSLLSELINTFVNETN